jgi:arylsulfatase A-like enzyme
MAGAGIVQPGRRSLMPTASIDLYPTLLDLANLPPPAGHRLDGVSLMPVMQAAKKLPTRQLFWHFPCYVGRSPPASMVREGGLKLLQFFEDGGHVELYDLANDPSESRNLAQQFPEMAAGLFRTLTSWQEKTQAALPRGDNPDFNPTAERPRGRGDDTNRQPKGGGGKGSAEKKRGQKKKQRMTEPKEK